MVPTSAPPVTLEANFDFARRQANLAEAQRQAEEIKTQAEAEAAKIHETAQNAEDKAKEEQEKARRDSEIAKKERADAEQAKAEVIAAQQATNLPSSEPPIAGPPPTPSPALSPEPDYAAPWPSASPRPPKNPSSTDSGMKGAEQLVQDLHAIEIQKSSVGSFDAKGNLEAILVVRDILYPNAPLQILSWSVDGQTHNTGNAQYTINLPVGTHKVSVEVLRATFRKKASAEVIISAEQKQATEPQIQVVPQK